MTENENKTTDTGDELLQNGYAYIGKKGPRFGARHTQIIGAALGASVVTVTKVGIFPLAIVAMTDNTTSSNPDVPTYDWNNTSVILSSIGWSGLLFPVLAGFLGKRYGPKWILIAANALNCFFFILIPFFAQWFGSSGVLFCRIAQGMAIAFYDPVSSVVSGRWIPPEERSRMAFVNFFILILSATVSSLSVGFISASALGWPSAFYIFGSLGFVWCIWYSWVGAQKPASHSHITNDELQYINVSLSVDTKITITPWKKILSNIHVWAVIIASMGSNWIDTMLSSELNSYMAKVLDFDITANAAIGILPTLTAVISGGIMAYLSDLIPKKGILSVVNSRRIFQVAGVVGLGLAIVGMTFVPKEHRTFAPVVLCLGNVFMMASNVGGSAINLLDISPKYAGVISGLVSMFGQASGLFAPLTVHWICTDQTDASQWRIVFIISLAFAVGTSVFFVIFSSSERQEWDDETELEARIEKMAKRGSVISLPMGLTVVPGV